jgi:hypothetical protein
MRGHLDDAPRAAPSIRPQPPRSRCNFILSDVRFATHYGLNSNIVLGPRSAISESRVHFTSVVLDHQL